MEKPESKPASASPSNENVPEVEVKPEEDADKNELQAKVEEVAAKLNEAMMEEAEKMNELIAVATTSTGSNIVSRPFPYADVKAKEPAAISSSSGAKDETGSDIVSSPSLPSSDAKAKEPVILSFSPPKVTNGVYDDEYEVEAILGKRTREGKVQYLLKWEGWPDESNSWEPEEHLANCKGLLDEFNEKWNADQLPKKGEKRDNDEDESENGTKKAKIS